MNTEIELKYLLDTTSVIERVNALLEKQSLPFKHEIKTLNNSYFDTENLALRRFDMGLRVRTAEDYREQTIKTAGTVVGGLHQRPEYNVSISQPTPELSLFPAEIWPEHANVDLLQQELILLFSTNFKRAIWTVTLDSGVIELAYDQGEIHANNKSQIISEIELELISGDVEAIFELAAHLFEAFDMRAGKLSKAARGYQMWHHKQEESLATLPVIDDLDEQVTYRRSLVPLREGQTRQAAFYTGLEYGLAKMQESIASYETNPKLEHIVGIRESLKVLHYGVLSVNSELDEAQAQDIAMQIEHLLTDLDWLDKALHVNELTTKSGRYRKKLEYSKQLLEILRIKRDSFPNEQEIKSLIQGRAFNFLQMTLLKLLIIKPKSEVLSDIRSFASEALESSLKELKVATVQQSALTSEQYLALREQLNKSLVTGSWFGGLYSRELRDEYRSPWIDILQGIDELAIFALLQKKLQQLDEQPEKLIRWLDGKIENLLDALEHSRKVAISVTPYWHAA